MKQKIVLLSKRICNMLAGNDIELCQNVFATLLLTVELMKGSPTDELEPHEVREALLRLAQMFLDKANEQDEPVRH